MRKDQRVLNKLCFLHFNKIIINYIKVIKYCLFIINNLLIIVYYLLKFIVVIVIIIFLHLISL